MNFLVNTERELSCRARPCCSLLFPLSSSSSSSSFRTYYYSLIGVFFVGLFLINKIITHESNFIFRALLPLASKKECGVPNLTNILDNIQKWRGVTKIRASMNDQIWDLKMAQKYKK